MLSQIGELVRTAPDWARADALSSEVTGWLDRARQAVGELDSPEAVILRVHLQHLRNDVVRHGSQIVEMLRRIDWLTKVENKKLA